MTKLTNAQMTALVAFGLVVLDSPDSLLDTMSRQEIKELAADIDKYLSPLVGDDAVVITPLVTILREAIEQIKAEQNA